MTNTYLTIMLYPIFLFLLVILSHSIYPSYTHTHHTHSLLSIAFIPAEAAPGPPGKEAAPGPPEKSGGSGCGNIPAEAGVIPEEEVDSIVPRETDKPNSGGLPISRKSEGNNQLRDESDNNMSGVADPKAAAPLGTSLRCFIGDSWAYKTGGDSTGPNEPRSRDDPPSVATPLSASVLLPPANPQSEPPKVLPASEGESGEKTWFQRMYEVVGGTVSGPPDKDENSGGDGCCNTVEVTPGDVSAACVPQLISGAAASAGQHSGGQGARPKTSQYKTTHLQPTSPRCDNKELDAGMDFKQRRRKKREQENRRQMEGCLQLRLTPAGDESAYKDMNFTSPKLKRLIEELKRQNKGKIEEYDDLRLTDAVEEGTEGPKAVEEDTEGPIAVEEVTEGPKAPGLPNAFSTLNGKLRIPSELSREFRYPSQGEGLQMKRDLSPKMLELWADPGPTTPCDHGRHPIRSVPVDKLIAGYMHSGTGKSSGAALAEAVCEPKQTEGMCNATQRTGMDADLQLMDEQLKDLETLGDGEPDAVTPLLDKNIRLCHPEIKVLGRDGQTRTVIRIATLSEQEIEGE
eukprot:GHVQ01030128.1.p1 GENE.GHVQ01030128.1~~GHVQ01030128.1.p1  ORF type:complete len:572 (-),score=86.62 GHVQ01030128.1:71-1786(-)